jgi:3-oxoacyl-[acyl-carrier protein] reductase
MIALVTGASRGIGRAIALTLAKKGYHILINFQSNTQAAEDTLAAIRAGGGSGELLPFDVSDAAECEQAIVGWQGAHSAEYIDVLVNNAGIRSDELLFWMKPEQFESVLRTNLFSFYNVTRHVITPMLSHKHGRIINIASLSGLTGLPGQCNYAAAKGGLIAATKALAKEVGKRRVTVNAVAPGFIRTEMVEGMNEDELKKTIPLNRFGTAEEVAAVVAFLASDEAAYITGECISVNGGLYT